MKRDLEALRDREIAERTNKHLALRLGALIRGDQQAIRTVDEALSHQFCDPAVMDKLIMLAVTDARQAGAMLNDLIERVVRADAENDATLEVEQIEKTRKQLADDARADALRWERMA